MVVIHKVTFKIRVYRLLFGDKSALSLCLGILGVLLSIGFFVADSQTENYALMNSHGSQLLWGVAYFLYGVMRIMEPTVRLDPGIKVFHTFVGMVLWLLLFLSFTVFDPSTVRPTELMLLTPVIMEFWLAIGAIDCFKAKFARRVTDE